MTVWFSTLRGKWSAPRARPISAAPSRAAARGLVVATALAAAGAAVVVHRTTPTPQALLATGESALVAVPANTTAASQTATTTTSTNPPIVATTERPAQERAGRVTAIGDSVLLEAREELAAAIDALSLDAVVGRQADATIAAAQALHDNGRFHDEVVLQVGNNGPVTPKQFDRLMSLFSDARRVVVLNLKVDREWEHPNNRVLAAGVSRWPKAVLVDWYSLGTANPDVFADHVHLLPAGVRLYARLILANL